MGEGPHLRPGPSVDQLAAGVVAGDRALLGRAITLVESSRADHREQAEELLGRLLPRTGGAQRVGVTGVPGVGKSTLIERLGIYLTEERERRLAVLAVDPSSARSGGSILGDKTRMGELTRHERAFVRPSPTGGTLGGVARRTRDAILLCEAAGYDTVLVETVGVGQSETVVAELVDTLLLLLLPHAGDELQGIKRGILELVDVVAVNKAEGENREAAERARGRFAAALRLVASRTPGWRVPVVTASARQGSGVVELWQLIEGHRRHLAASGELERRRRGQATSSVWALVEEGLLAGFRQHPRVASLLPDLEARVAAGELLPAAAARRLLAAFAARR